jgi:transcription elongation factor Elf1
MSGGGFDFDDDEKEQGSSSGRAQKDFDCPSCNANNPVDEPLAHGDEVRCNYCGSEFKVTVTTEGRVKFKEV